MVWDHAVAGSNPATQTNFLAAENQCSSESHKLAPVGATPTPATNYGGTCTKGGDVALQAVCVGFDSLCLHQRRRVAQPAEAAGSNPA